jgi:two-component system, NarL family, sensor histidine kinase DevS
VSARRGAALGSEKLASRPSADQDVEVPRRPANDRGEETAVIADTLLGLGAAQLIEAAPDATLIVDETGTIVVANASAVSLFGYAHDQLVGQLVEALVPVDKRTNHVTDRKDFQASPHRRPMGVGLELTAVPADGSEVPVEVSLSPLVVGERHLTIASARDISARLAQVAERQRVRRALDAARDGIAMFDLDSLVFTYVNRGFVEQTGYTVEELLARRVCDLRQSWDEVAVRAFLQPLADGEADARTASFRLQRPDGDEIPVEVLVQRPPIGGDEQPLYISIMRDLSERTRAEQALQETHDRLVLVEERERIARDLHDTVIQRIFAVGLRLQTAAAMAPDKVRDRIVDVVDDLDITIRELRTAVFQLGSPPQSQHGARGQILAVAAEAGRVLGFEPQVRFDGVIDERLTPVVLDHLLPTLREALTNVARHAAASRVTIDVQTGTDLRVLIQDDGKGLAPDRIPGNGLGNMTERARTLGGACTISPGPHGGTAVEWRVPC